MIRWRHVFFQKTVHAFNSTLILLIDGVKSVSRVLRGMNIDDANAGGIQ